jgi:hypothetical protein
MILPVLSEDICSFMYIIETYAVVYPVLLIMNGFTVFLTFVITRPLIWCSFTCHRDYMDSLLFFSDTDATVRMVVTCVVGNASRAELLA